MLCELHRAALNGWSVRYLPLSLRRELRSMTKRERYWDGDNAEEDGESEFGYSSGSEQEGDPFDTPDSRELRQLELRLSTDEKGSIPVGKAWSSVPTAVSIRLAGRIKGQNLLDAVVHAGWGLWVMFVDVAMRRSCARISEYADHFSHLIATRKFELLWAQINALYQMGSVRKRCRCPVGVDQHGQAFSEQSLDDGHCHWEEKGLAHLLDKEKAVKKGRLRFASIRSSPRIKKIRKRKGRGTASGTEDGKRRETYFAYLPEEVLTEHIIPMLCLEGKQRQRRLEHDI